MSKIVIIFLIKTLFAQFFYDTIRTGSPGVFKEKGHTRTYLVIELPQRY